MDDENKWLKQWRTHELKRVRQMKAELDRLGSRLEAYAARIPEGAPGSSPVECAAVKRATLDLTRCLAAFRRGE